jgi:hypothetical protein
MEWEGSPFGFGGGLWGSVFCLVFVLAGLWVRRYQRGHEELRRILQKLFIGGNNSVDVKVRLD